MTTEPIEEFNGISPCSAWTEGAEGAPDGVDVVVLILSEIETADNPSMENLLLSLSRVSRE
jgi:hypothetical protein